MRAAFVETLIDLARKDERIYLLVADVGFNLVEPFATEFPKRFLNTGIAEQNMVSVATGLALSGKVVFTYTLTNFATFRCAEQIRNDACYHNANVKIVASGAGLAYGTLGATHHATQDLAIMRALPGMVVASPADPVEVRLVTRALASHDGPCYLRLGRTGDPVIHRESPAFQLGRSIAIQEGKDLTIIGTGGIMQNVVLAAQRLAQKGKKARVLSVPVVKPLDAEAILLAAKDTGAILTVEEHNVVGGLGSAVAEVLAESGVSRVPFKRLAIEDVFCREVGNQEYLIGNHGLSVDSITEAALGLVG